jgi:hypothetical protein
MMCVDCVAKLAALGDPKQIPQCGMPLEIPGTNPGEMLRIGDGVWEGVKMVSRREVRDVHPLCPVTGR